MKEPKPKRNVEDVAYVDADLTEKPMRSPMGHPPRHGHACGNGSATYGSWQAMIQRCTNPRRGDWHRYGGLGVKVCDRWLTFDNFLADIGQRPPGMTLDRFPNRTGNYEPGNVRWATATEQSRGRRTTKYTGKLEPHEPAQIRWLASLGYFQRDIGAHFDISQTMVGKIVRNERWI